MARQNKSIELADLLKHQIKSGQLKAGDQLEPIVKLAKHYRTTIATVSKSLGQLEQSGYVECMQGKGVFVKARPGCRLAIVLDDIIFGESFSISLMPIMMREIDRKCREQNWAYELFFNVKDSRSAREFILKLSQNSYDVVLVGSLWLAENYATIFKDRSLFTIGLYPYKELPFAMSFDSYKMSYDAVLELNRLGCRQIALIDNNRDLSWSAKSQSVIDGYNDGLKNIGILRDPRLLLNVPISQTGGHGAFCELLKYKSSQPFGIICCDSLITLGLIQAVQSHWLKIPEEVMIASHVNQGCGAGQFTLPIIKYEYPINAHVDRIAGFIQDFNEGRKPPTGIDLMSPVKKVSVPTEDRSSITMNERQVTTVSV